MKVQLAAGVAVALLAFAAMPQAHADGYDYGYGPVYGGYGASNGTCPSGQCSGSYSPIYSASYPVYGAPTYSAQTCPNGSCGGTCGSCANGSCGMRGQCSGGQCSSGQCSSGQCSSGQCSSGQCSSGQCAGGQCSTGQCSNGSCRNGRCGTCPNGDCERGNCSGNCPNGQCTTRYRGPVDPDGRPRVRNNDRPEYGAREETSYRPSYSSERPAYRDYRDEPVSRRSWRSDSRPLNRDNDRESPFYN
jgi:hypothetical protein